MTQTLTLLIDASYALAVCGAALVGAAILGPAGAGLGLPVAALYLIGQAVLADRRSEA